MKKTMACLAAAACCAAFADLKIATVNMVELLSLHPTHESNKTLVKSTGDDYKRKMEAKQTALKELADEAKKAYEDLQNPMLSAGAKAELQKKLEGIQQQGGAARQELLRADQHFREELADLETRLLRLETADIRAKVSAYAKQNGYSLIVDSTTAVWAADALDVTDDILKALNVDPAKRKKLKEEKNEGK